MSKFAPHRLWCAALLGALALLFGSGQILGYAHDALTRENAALTEQQRERAATLQQRRDDDATARRLNESLSESEMEKYLAPSDRVKAAAALAPLANAARFGAFTYSLSPERPAALEGLENGAVFASQLTLQADVPHDIAVRQFFQRLGEIMAGRLQIQHLRLERLATEQPAALNLRLTAQAQWFSNGGDAPKAAP